MDPYRLRSLAVVPAARLFAVFTLMCLWFCAPVRVAFAQSATSEKPANDSHPSTGPVHGDYYARCLYLVKTQTIYPPAAITAGISGTVVLEATIAGTGDVADVRVLSGPAMLQQESLNAVRTWRCRPYLVNDVPTVRRIKINVIFTLEEDGSATIRTTQGEWEIVNTPLPAEDVKPPESRSPQKEQPIRINTSVVCSPTKRTQPVYPPIAKAARISGTVVLEALISKTGVVSDLRVVSGPPLLRQASIDAVRTWRFRPYMVNGVPMEEKTTVNVVFTIGEDGTTTAKATASDPKVVETTPPANDAKQPESK